MQLSEYNGTLSASVYIMIALIHYIQWSQFFLILLVVIGKRKGFTSALGLILHLFVLSFISADVYLGFSPFLVQLL